MFLLILLVLLILVAATTYGARERKFTALYVGEGLEPPAGLFAMKTSGPVDIFLFHQSKNLRFDSRYFDTPCRVMNLLQRRCHTPITDKKKLAESMGKFMPKRSGFAASDGPVILKRVGGKYCHGRGIEIFSTYAEAEHAAPIDEPWVIEELIQNILLCEGRKFHVRAYLYIDDKRNWALCDYADLILADVKYSAAVTGADPKIFISTNNSDYCRELGSGKFTRAFSGEASPFDATDFFRQANVICEKLPDLFEPTCYENAERCYEVFGCDFLVTAEERVVLLEINDIVGYEPVANKRGDPAWLRSMRKKKNDVFRQKFYAWLLQQPVFKWL